MKIELDFKHKIDGFPFEEKKKNQGLAVMQPNTKARYADLARQKERAERSASYIGDKSKRRKYVFAFADGYRAVLDKECQKFYKKNPQAFRKERGQHFMAGIMSGGFSALLTVYGQDIAISIGASMKYGLLGGLITAGGCAFALVSAGMMGKGVVMSCHGASKCKAFPGDFLCVFKNDENLKELWFSEKNKEMRVSQKSYKNKEKALQKINAYHETRNWLQQWSEGDLDRLRKVEWLALCGIAKKYGKHLTPVDSNQECTVSAA